MQAIILLKKRQKFKNSPFAEAVRFFLYDFLIFNLGGCDDLIGSFLR